MAGGFFTVAGHISPQSPLTAEFESVTWPIEKRK